MNKPMISVVMPVYNGDKYLREAIDSILNQTYRDFEFIILNDGSTDKTEEIILSYHDSRIVYVKNEENLQIVKTLNKGIALAKGKYIARMDADDISLPERFEKQVSIFESDEEIGIVGSFVEIFGKGIVSSIWKVPLQDIEIKLSIFFRTPFIHPVVMMKKSIIDKYQLKYNKEYKNVEDYELWTRFLKYTRGVNVSNVLLRYRILENSITREAEKNTEERFVQKLSIYKTVLKDFNIINSEDEHNLHYELSSNKVVKLDRVKIYFDKILSNVSLSTKKEKVSLKRILGQIWLQNIKKTILKKPSSIMNKYTIYGLMYYVERFLLIRMSDR